MPLDLAISPIQTELSLAPRQTKSQVYNLKNTSDKPITINITFSRWEPTGTDGSVKYLPQSDTSPIKFSILNADLVGTQGIPLAPGQQRQFVIGATDTEGQLGDYYYTVFFEENPAPSLGDTQSSVSGKIGSHLLLSVQDSAPEKIQGTAQIKPQFKIFDPFIQTPTVDIFITNPTAHYYRLVSELFIEKQNEKITSLKLSPETIVANSTKLIPCIELNTDNTQSTPTACKLKNLYLPGAYTLHIGTAENTNLEANEVSIYSFPFSIIGLILSVSAILFLIKKKNVKKQ